MTASDITEKRSGGYHFHENSDHLNVKSHSSTGDAEVRADVCLTTPETPSLSTNNGLLTDIEPGKQLSRFRPLPVSQEESLFSWHCRLAWKNGLSAGDLYSTVLPGGSLHSYDLDRIACPSLFAGLHQLTGVEIADMEARTLRRWCGTIYDNDDGRRKLIWLTPVGKTGSKASFGQQVCVQCLDDDEIPYLRVEWRLAFYTVCPVHKVLLIDRCPHCQAPIQPSYLISNLSVAMTSCWKCHEDLRKAPVSPVTFRLRPSIQDALVKHEHAGWAPLGNAGMAHSLVWFRVLWMVYRLLATGTHSLALRQIVQDRYDNASSVTSSSIPRIREIERLKPHQRHYLLNLTNHLIEDWPHRFVEACRSVGLTNRDLVKEQHKSEQIPFVWKSTVDNYLSHPRRKFQAEEFQSAQEYLKRKGIKPTRTAMIALCSNMLLSHKESMATVGDRKPRDEGRYWKLDGVSSEVKKASRREAIRQGEPLGAWVDQMLRKSLNLSQKSLHIDVPETPHHISSHV